MKDDIKMGMIKNLRVSDKMRKYRIHPSGEVFSQEELRTLINIPYNECKSIQEFEELADWCAETDALFERLTAITKNPEWIKLLEDKYGT